MARMKSAPPDIHRKRKTLNRLPATLRRKTTSKIAGISIEPKRKKFKCLRSGEGGIGGVGRIGVG